MKRWCLLLALLCLLMTGCAGADIPYEQGDGRSYCIVFEQLRAMRRHEFTLKAGDELRVRLECQSGDIGISILDQKGQKVYSGSSSASSRFKITIPEDGTYIVTVMGDNASGSVRMLAGEGSGGKGASGHKEETPRRRKEKPEETAPGNEKSSSEDASTQLQPVL